MGKHDALNGRINKLEKLLIREMAKRTNLEEENKRLKDGSLAEYYKKQFYTLEKKHVQLHNEVIILKMELSNLKEPKLEPEDVTFYCNNCEAEISAQIDIANEGRCNPCNEGQNEMWAKEMRHEAYEYRDMKL
jgi:hypothetical protein